MGTDHDRTSGEEGPTRRRRLLTSPVIWGVVFLALLSGSFAASISINNDQPAEFGQGVQEIAACDDDTPTGATDPGITVSLGSAADVVEGQFDVTNVFLTDIDAACKGKYLKLGLYDAAGALLDDVVFFMDPTYLLSGSAPFRAAALSPSVLVTPPTGCDQTPSPADFPDGAAPTEGRDCWVASGTDYGLLDAIAAEDVSYVTIESSDNPPTAAL